MTSSESNEKVGLSRLLPYFLMLRPLWLPFSGALVCGLVYGISSGFGLPYMVDQVFPKIFPSEGSSASQNLSSQQLALYVAWLPAVFLIRGVSGYCNSYLISYCGVRVLEKIRLQVFSKMQMLPLSFFQKNKAGDLLSRISSDTGQIQTTLLSVSNDLIRQPVTFVGALSALVVMALQREGMAFVLLCLVVIPVCIFPIRRVGEILMRKALGMQEMAGNMTAVLSENLSASREIRAFNLQEQETKKFHDSSKRFFNARMKVIKYSNLLTPIIEIITAVGISVAIFQASRTSIRLDAVVPVIMALYLSYDPIKKLGAIQNQIKQAFASIQRLDHILKAEETVRDVDSPISQKVKGELRFENVSFSYQGNDLDSPPALLQINLKIEPGEVVALVGPSGAGKTTFASLLPRFFDPSSGSILLDGIDLRNFSLHALREAVAMVPQKPFLFDLSVRQNIHLGQSQYSNAEIEKAAELSHCLEFIQDLPGQFEQRLGENGSLLSGGQVQRLAMARAFHRNSPILILDEATSALDSENEEKIHQAMSELIKGKTTLLIAHRFSSIRLANRIIVLDEGKIVADGSHDEIHESCTLYRRLYDQQNANSVS